MPIIKGNKEYLKEQLTTTCYQFIPAFIGVCSDDIVKSVCEMCGVEYREDNYFQEREDLKMIEIKVKNGTLLIYTPYNAKFVSAIKKIGGAKWDSENKCWTAPEEFVDAVREIMLDVYGYTDISKNESITKIDKLVQDKISMQVKGDILVVAGDIDEDIDRVCEFLYVCSKRFC